jgi:hypothetical protein
MDEAGYCHRRLLFDQDEKTNESIVEVRIEIPQRKTLIQAERDHPES